MKNCKSIAKIEEYNQIFKMIIFNMKDCFILIFFRNVYMIEDIIYVEFDEMLYILNSIHNFDDKEYRIMILDDHAI